MRDARRAVFGYGNVSLGARRDGDDEGFGFGGVDGSGFGGAAGSGFGGFGGFGGNGGF